MLGAKIALSVLGLLFGYFVYFFFQVLIKFVVGKCLGYEFLYMVLYVLHIKAENGKVVCKVTNPQLSAKLGMIRRKNSDVCSFIYEFLPVVLILIPFFIIRALAGRSGDPFLPVDLNNLKGYILFVPFTMRGWLLCIVLELLLKVISFKSYFSNDPSAVLIRKCRDITQKMLMGIRPADIEMQPAELKDKMSSAELRYALYDYYNHLDKGEYNELENYIRVFDQNSPQVYNQNYMPYFQEMLFYYSFSGNLTAAQNLFSMLNTDFQGDKDINGRRVYAYFLYYTNKGAKQAMETAKEGLANADSYPAQGIAEMEKSCLTN